MKDLEKYTDDELRNELKRRSIERRKAKAKEPRERYRYYEVTIEKRYPEEGREKIVRFVDYYYYLKEDIEGKKYSTKLKQGCFKKQDAPRVGDVVRVCGHNYANPAKNIFTTFYIDKIIKRKEEL